MLYYFVTEKGYSLREILNYNEMEMIAMKAIFEIKIAEEKKWKREEKKR